jgi:hypothetical protein
MKSEDIYGGKLNLERISAYKELAKEYRLQEGTVRDIFCKGAEWGIGITNREIAFPKFYPILPDDCTHPEEWRTHYDGGAVWCNRCHSYINLPSSKDKVYFNYKNAWYEKGDTLRYGWFKYKVTFIGTDGSAIIWRKGKEVRLKGGVGIYELKEIITNKKEDEKI